MILLSLLAALASAASPLPPLSIEKGSVTVSGISSGAFMAVQLQVALSEKIRGVGSVAGGIFGCSKGSSGRALVPCMKKPSAIRPAELVTLARKLSEQEKIDSVANLAGARVYVFHGESDEVVKPEAAGKLAEFFTEFRSEIRIELLPGAAHGFPTLSYGNSCGQSGLPWISNCGFDGAGKILSHLYPDLPASAAPATGETLAFEQSLYAPAEAGLLTEGFVYIPTQCRSQPCRLHFALHGCEMSTDFVKKQFISEAGYNRWADAGSIVVVYPQVARSKKNPNACWDWFGYTGKDFATREGPQVKFIHRILDELNARETSGRGEKLARGR